VELIFYHPYFDIEHYEGDGTVFDINETLKWIADQFGIDKETDIALSSDNREGFKQSYHCVLFTKKVRGIRTKTMG
jgi:hypothetical protein